MASLKLRAALPLLFLCLATIPTNAQTGDLLQNPKADLEAQHWRAFGQTVVEEVNGDRSFVVRNGGYFLQDVTLPEGEAKQSNARHHPPAHPRLMRAELRRVGCMPLLDCAHL